MTIKYAYLHPITREYLYTDSQEELKDVLAGFAAQTYIEHYCNGQPYTLVETQEDGSEKWFSPTGEQVMSAAEMKAAIKRVESMIKVGEIPTTIL